MGYIISCALFAVPTMTVVHNSCLFGIDNFVKNVVNYLSTCLCALHSIKGELLGHDVQTSLCDGKLQSFKD